MTIPLARTASADELAERLLDGDRLALTRMISAVEAGREDARQTLSLLFPKTGRAHVVGITGPPGSGKSTLTTRVTVEYRARGQTVGIVAVDPSSPFTGGAILGDRVRMMELHSDPGVFMRSMATRGVLGGMARSTLDVVLLLDAFGKDVVLVETVGVGQDEVDVARAADTTLVVGVPNLGDDIQALKAGILEIADILVVNKADLSGADRLSAELRAMLQLADERAWPVPIQQTVATEGTGVSALLERIVEHRSFLERSGTFQRRRAESARRQVRAIVEERILQRLEHLTEGASWEQRFASIAARDDDPYSVAEEVLGELARYDR